MKTTVKKYMKHVLYSPYYCLKGIAPKTADRLHKLLRPHPHETKGVVSKIRRLFLLIQKIHQLETDVQRAIELQSLTLIQNQQPSFRLMDHSEPSFEHPVCQLATAQQFQEPKFHFWCAELREPFKMHRKLWEFCYVLEVLQQFRMLEKGKRGLGFGVGLEPLPAIFAKYGCQVVATDQDEQDAASQGWIREEQYALSKSNLNTRGICDAKQFDQLVQFEVADMKNIPAHFQQFDFVWSCCSLEHLGNLEEGWKFFKRSIDCLKPGGVAVHTTEFNVSSNHSTLTEGLSVIYRRQDVLTLITALTQMGHEVLHVNLHPGSSELDQFVDVPPYNSDRHLKLKLSSYTSTSIGIVVKKGH